MVRALATGSVASAEWWARLGVIDRLLLAPNGHGFCQLARGCRIVYHDEYHETLLIMMLIM
jgi:hypothetical protein